MKYIVPLIAAFASCLLLVSCGSGSGGDNTETVRPKTMDGIILSLDNNASTIEFIRNMSSPPAVNSGDIETGTFIYTSNVGLANLRFYDNLGGSLSNLWWPQSVGFASYTYRAVNESSGVLTMTAVGNIQSTYYSIGGQQLNGSIIIPFKYSSAAPDSLSIWDETNVVEIDVSFTADGAFVNSDTITMRLPESAMVTTLDTVRIPSTVRLAEGGKVPVNYGPEIDPLRPSRIAPASLGNKLFAGTNGIPDTSKNFTIQFVADASGSMLTNVDEVGTGILRVFVPGALITDPGEYVVVTNALNYTWRRIPGTDDGELVLSGIPDDAALSFDSSLNGSYRLSFQGDTTGIYVGTVDSDTANAEDVSGTFSILNGD